MLTIIVLQFQLPVIEGLLCFYGLEQLLDIVLCQEGTTQYSQDFTNASVKIEHS